MMGGKFLLCKTESGTSIGVNVDPASLSFDEITVSDPFGEFYRFRIVADAMNQPLGWRIQNMAVGGNAVIRLADPDMKDAQ